jgi:hypothetical protein
MKTNLIAALLLISAYVSAQNHFNGFASFKKINEETAVVYFSVTGNDDFKIDEFNEILLNYPGVSSSGYVNEPAQYRFKCVISNKVSAEDIKLLLYQFGFKMDANSLHSRNNEVNVKQEKTRSTEQLSAPHYPDYVNTGNPELDAQTFDRAKQEWIKNYPDEVNILRGMEAEEKKELTPEK